jgi:predicted nucleic acid-binding protein
VIVMLDINVLLDVFLVRQPHYTASAHVLSLVANQKLTGVVAAHGLTTLYYLASKQAERAVAEEAVDHVIQHCRIATLDNKGWRKARQLAFTDFEDAVIASIAEEPNCETIITRNTLHFVGSAFPALVAAGFSLLIP